MSLQALASLLLRVVCFYPLNGLTNWFDVLWAKEYGDMCSFLGNNNLCGAVVSKQCKGQPPFPPPPPYEPPPPPNSNGNQGIILSFLISCEGSPLVNFFCSLWYKMLNRKMLKEIHVMLMNTGHWKCSQTIMRIAFFDSSDEWFVVLAVIGHFTLELGGTWPLKSKISVVEKAETIALHFTLELEGLQDWGSLNGCKWTYIKSYMACHE